MYFFSLTVCTLDQYYKNGSVGFAPIGSNAEAGPPLPIAIGWENSAAMYKSTGILRPAWSV